MSIILNFSGNSTTLYANYFPPIELNTPYECGLISLYTYNSIPNITAKNNTFHVGNKSITLPSGSYEIDDIAAYIEKELEQSQNPKITAMIRANTNTLTTEIEASEEIHFDKENSIGSLLGFSKKKIPKNKLVSSDLPVKINTVNSIRVECNLVVGTYMNNTPVHTIHEFAPDVPPGYKINEIPKNIIYLPVNAKTISSVAVRLVDQDGNLIDFRDETITIRLHLRPAAMV